jgi:hypothetical protein
LFEVFFVVRLAIISRVRMGKWYGDDMVRFDEPCFVMLGAFGYYRGYMVISDHLCRRVSRE